MNREGGSVAFPPRELVDNPQQVTKKRKLNILAKKKGSPREKKSCSDEIYLLDAGGAVVREGDLLG